MSFQLCASDPLPSFSSIYDSVKSRMTFPPAGFVFPQLPTIPDPLFPKIRMPNMETMIIAAELQAFQLMNTILGIVKPIIDYLGLAISALIPKIPGLDINLLDLLTMNASSLYTMVKNMLPDVVLPFVPYPIYFSLSIPDMEIKNKVTMLIKGYMTSLITTVTEIVGKVVKYIKDVIKIGIPSLPELPKIPTIQELKTMMLAQFPDMPDFKSMLTKYSLEDIFRIAIPGFPPFVFPKPLVPNFSSKEIDFTELLNILYNELLLTPLKMIVDFCKNVLSRFIGFAFPTFCITL